MYAHQRGTLGAGLTPYQGQVDLAIHHVLIGNETELTVGRGQPALVDALDGLLVLDPVVDQVRDGADLQTVLRGEDLEIRRDAPWCRPR